jgi:hypothetical protein
MSESQQPSHNDKSNIDKRYRELVSKAYQKADSIEELESLLGY